MKGLLHYQFINYARSFRYIPPLSIFIIYLIVNYTYTPNPILDSYAVTSLVLFFMMGWFTVTVFHAEDNGQKRITLLHAKNSKDSYLSLYLLCALIGLCLSLVAVAYPVVFNLFGVKVHSLHIVMGLLSHTSLASLAIALSAIFTRDIVKNMRNTWWGVMSILIISLAVVTLKNTIIQLNGLIWLLPPVHLSLEMMSLEDSIEAMPRLFYWQFGWIFIYGFLFIGLFFWRVRQRRFI